MNRQFPLFQSHIDLAHAYWKRILCPGDWAIDATCGSGQDTLFLAKTVQGTGKVIGIDIQKEAIERTKKLLNDFPSTLAKVHLFPQSHEDFPLIAYEKPIKLIVYNLGYLPRGNKQLTTRTASTLQSVKKGLHLLSTGGALSITCYPGHPEGANEEKALTALCSELSAALWNVCFHSFVNRNASPSLLVLQLKL